MPARHRIYIPGLSVHVIHRGNNRTSIFDDTTDYHVFLAILQDAMRSYRVAIHAFILMTTHYHLVVTPDNESALPSAMQQLGVRYVCYYNRKYARVGTLWCGRYRGLLIDNEEYWLACVRYVEQNPVRASMVAAPGAYRWSSYGFHALGHPAPWLTPHHVYLALGSTDEERQSKYRLLCEISLTDEELVRQRTGWPILKPAAPKEGSDPGQTRVGPASERGQRRVRPPS